MPIMKFPRGGSNPILQGILASIVAVAICACCRQASAQQPAAAAEAPAAAAQPKGFRELTVYLEEGRLRSQVMQMLRAHKFESGQEEIFDKYYKRYVLPRWTQRKYYEQLPNFRKELRNDLMTGRSGPPHDRLNALALDYLNKMSGAATMHPVVRFNAMLMIGDLNSQQPKSRAEPGVALPESLPILLKALDDEKQIEAVKVAALIGIIRHAQMGIANEQARAQVVAEMLKLAAAKNAPGRSAAGHAWMRCQAVEALAALGTVGPQGSVAKTLVAIIADPAAPLPLRCTAAWAIGELKYQGAGGLDLATMVTQLGGLAADICETEFKRLEEVVAEATPKTGRRSGFVGGMPGDMEGGMMYQPRRGAQTAQFEEHFKASRRALMARLANVAHGLKALASVAGGSNQQETIVALQEKIEDLLTSLEDSDLDDYDPEYAEEDTLVGLLKKERAELQALLSSDAKAKKPAPKKAAGN